jgi:hypothetical protein
LPSFGGHLPETGHTILERIVIHKRAPVLIEREREHARARFAMVSQPPTPMAYAGDKDWVSEPTPCVCHIRDIRRLRVWHHFGPAAQDPGRGMTRRGKWLEIACSAYRLLTGAKARRYPGAADSLPRQRKARVAK